MSQGILLGTMPQICKLPFWVVGFFIFPNVLTQPTFPREDGNKLKGRMRSHVKSEESPENRAELEIIHGEGEMPRAKVDDGTTTTQSPTMDLLDRN